jgi:Zinc dependent phospholipase C
MTRPATCILRLILVAVVLLAVKPQSSAYSVLTHEQIVDLLWKDQIEPLLLKRFPDATEDDLRKAHSYAYGGSVIQDMGYYPFGNKFFSDLVHYVRTGDFVEALIRESSNVNEYAFALGALAHYSSDNEGHPAINRAVAIEFPDLEKKYGPEVTYVEDPKAHIRCEFGFDMVQVAKNRYTSDQYHDFIGFEVSKEVLDRGFYDTYQLHLQDVFGDVDLAIGTFRRSISKIIPEMTRVALLSRKQEIVHDTPNFNEKKFLFYLSKADYDKEWGSVYRRPGFGTRMLAYFLKIMPKVGPFKAVAFKVPSTKTEDMYVKSVNDTVENYQGLLKATAANQLNLPNTDCDTGRPTRPGEYRLADRTYAKLLDQLSTQNFQQISAALRDNLLAYYADPSAPNDARKDKKVWKKTEEDINKLKNTSVADNSLQSLVPQACSVASFATGSGNKP